jgi:hypothetical protein
LLKAHATIAEESRSSSSLDPQDIDALKKCKPGDCDVQLPASYMDDFRKTVDWTSPTVAEQIDKDVREAGLQELTAYQRDGNRALDVYYDKQHPVDVAEQFKYMISYSKALPEYLPDVYGYLLTYPGDKPAKTEDSFYWSKVKFGLKPTLRVVHVITTQKPTKDSTAYFIAEKQLYASHYFETALDLTSCIPDSPDSKGKFFYLIKVMGSEQAGLTGAKGSVVRKAAIDLSPCVKCMLPSPVYNSFFRFARDLTEAPSDASKQRQTLGDLRGQSSAMVSRSKKGHLFEGGPIHLLLLRFWLTECFSNRLTFAVAT